MKQFNWRKYWAKKVTPFLQDESVQFALNLGMMIWNENWKPGDPPYLEGAIGFNRVITGKLSWYQPLNRCRWIAPFSWPLGKKIFPELQWGFMTSQSHTIAIGLKEKEIEIVMDILLFDSMTAEESVEHVKKKDYKACFSIREVFVK